MKEVKVVTFRVDRVDEKRQDQTRSWLSAQNNMQRTMDNAFWYFRERFGDVDLTDFEVQRILMNDLNEKTEIKPTKKAEQIFYSNSNNRDNSEKTENDTNLADSISQDDF